MFYKCQSIGVKFCFANSSLVLEKCLFPNQYPLLALNGEGCPVIRTWCLVWSIKLDFFLAKPPQSKKTIPFRWSDSFTMAASENLCQPIFLWEFAWWARTVNPALSNKIPWLAHFYNFPVFVIFIPISVFNSLNIFFKEGGAGNPSGTEKLKPHAWPMLW